MRLYLKCAVLFDNVLPIADAPINGSSEGRKFSVVVIEVIRGSRPARQRELKTKQRDLIHKTSALIKKKRRRTKKKTLALYGFLHLLDVFAKALM